QDSPRTQTREHPAFLIMPWAILDSSIYIGHWESGLYEDILATVRRGFVVRHSAVVLSELRRGARTRAARHLVYALHRIARDPWVPRGVDWWRAGEIICKIGDRQGWGGSRRRDFQNDALIALTARARRATVVTANREDFAPLALELHVSII